MLRSAKSVNVLIKKATKLAWEMATLVPPAVLSTPDIQEDLWQTVLHGSDEPEDSEIIYRKPILFFSASGDVGEKGEIKLVKKGKPALAQQKRETIASIAAESKDPVSSSHLIANQAYEPCSPTTMNENPQSVWEASGSKSTTEQASLTADAQCTETPDAFEMEMTPIIREDSSGTPDEQLPPLDQKDLNESLTPPSAQSNASFAQVPHVSNGSLSVGNGEQMRSTSESTPSPAQPALDSKEQHSDKPSYTNHSPAVADSTSSSSNSAATNFQSYLEAKQNPNHQILILDSAPGNTSNPTNDKTSVDHLQQTAAQDQQQKSVVEETGSETVPTPDSQPILAIKYSDEKVMTATESDENQEVVGNVTATECAQVPRTGDHTAKQSDIDRKAELKGAASPVQQEVDATSQAVVEPDRGRKISRPSAHSSKPHSKSQQSALALLSSEGFSETRKPNSRRRNKNSKQGSAKAGMTTDHSPPLERQTYTCPAQPFGTWTSWVSEETSHCEGKKAENLPVSSEKPIKERADVWDVD